ncbi:MAG: acetate--CoA ligase family protein [Promethearchaeota archaeon]
MKISESNKIIKEVYEDKRRFLMEHESKSIVSEYGVPVGEFKVVNSQEEAVDYAKSIGFPVVAKLMSPEIIHKTEAGVIKLNLKNEEEVKTAFNEVIENAMNYKADAKITGVSIQKMAEGGIVEIIIGGIRDTHFGPVLMFGLGGIFVEIFKDVSYRVCPITADETNKMIRSIKAFPLLDGYRGTPKADINQVVDTITKCCKMMMDNPQIEELDLNPIIVFEDGKGIIVVDARIILEEGGS